MWGGKKQPETSQGKLVCFEEATPSERNTGKISAKGPGSGATGVYRTCPQ